MQVREGMSPMILAVGPGHTLRDAARLMSERHVGAAVVIDPDAPGAGILTERDVLSRVVVAQQLPDRVRVGDVMTRDVICCSPETDLDEISAIMKTRRVRHVPICGDNGTLHGLVSIGDMVKHRLAECEYEHKAMREYIATA